ncbi:MULTISPECIES: hypothetical protein [unclassified Mesorhizobium]|uniref:hypothetical protein n=1 Tax=unclassified Mesorhizobium TaxID=325217 RepID=UPI001FDF48F9|nr:MULTISPECIES: hypothetical protein [unclassified Mesorhizobium]
MLFRAGEHWLNPSGMRFTLRLLAGFPVARYIGRMSKGWTFPSLIDAKMTVTAFCHWSPCNHSQKLDLAQLRDRYGPDSPAMADDLITKLKCDRCGGTMSA